MEVKTTGSNKRVLNTDHAEGPARKRIRRFILEGMAPPASSAALAQIAGSYLVAPGQWGPLHTDACALAHASAETEASAAQLASYRNQLLRQKWMSGTYARFAMRKLKDLGPGVLAEMYAQGYTARELSLEYDLPPMYVARELGWTEEKKGGTVLTAGQQAELAWCQEHDVVFPVDQAADATLQNATKYEENVAAVLRALGLGFSTQDDLKAEHKAQLDFLIDMRSKYGVPESARRADRSEEEEDDLGTLPQLGPTPDFVLASPIMIHGRMINWIDAKNCFGSTVPHMLKRMQKQTAKYTDTWGPGALFFSLGFEDGLAKKLPDVLCLAVPVPCKASC